MVFLEFCREKAILVSLVRVQQIVGYLILIVASWEANYLTIIFFKEDRFFFFSSNFHTYYL